MLTTDNTFTGINTFNNLLKSNNITAPSSTIAGVNNIYTNLDPVNGLGIVNFGARGNNINIKCNFNINESAYGTSQNTLIWMEGNNTRFENDGSTGGTYIFTINESGTYNPLVINKTSIDIVGDVNLEGNLKIYDTATPSSTKRITIGVVDDDITFDPVDTVNTTYNFITNDGGSIPITALVISLSQTTFYTNVAFNSQATFNNGAVFNSVIPTTSITASSANHLVNYSTLTGQGLQPYQRFKVMVILLHQQIHLLVI